MAKLIYTGQTNDKIFKTNVEECVALFKQLKKEQKLEAWRLWNHTAKTMKTLILLEKDETTEFIMEETSESNIDILDQNLIPTPQKRLPGRPRKNKNENFPAHKKLIENKLPCTIDIIDREEKDNETTLVETKYKDKDYHAKIMVSPTSTVRRSTRKIKPSKIYPELSKISFKRDENNDSQPAETDLVLPDVSAAQHVGVYEIKPIVGGDTLSDDEIHVEKFSQTNVMMETNKKSEILSEKDFQTDEMMDTENKDVDENRTEMLETDEFGDTRKNAEGELSNKFVDTNETDKNNKESKSIIAMVMEDCEIEAISENSNDGTDERDNTGNVDPSDEDRNIDVEKLGSRNESQKYTKTEMKSLGKTKAKQRLTGTESVKCRECGKMIANKSNLGVHMRVHTGEKPYGCTLCNKTFSNKQNMLRHEQTHVGLKPFKCKECGKCFTENKSLKVHMRSHTGEKPYVCVHCGRGFNQTGTLQSHMHIHTGWKGHLCQLCGKSFRQKSQLKTHMLRHENIRNYPCPNCNKTFFSKGDMDRHRSCHTGERPYLCTLCPKTFTRMQYLKEHMNIHTGNKPHKCRFCNESFPDMSSCSRHIKRHDEIKPKTIGDGANIANETVYVVQYCQDSMLQAMHNVQSATGESLLVPQGPETSTLEGAAEKQGHQNIPYMVLEENVEPKIVNETDVVSHSTNPEVVSGTFPEILKQSKRFVEISVSQNDEQNGEMQQIILQTNDDQPLDLSDQGSLLQAILEASRQHKNSILPQNIVISHNATPEVASVVSEAQAIKTAVADTSVSDQSNIDILAAATEQEHLYSAPVSHNKGP